MIEGVNIDKLKRYLYTGIFINCLLCAITSPLINVYFMKRVNNVIFSVVNWVTIVSVLITSHFLTKQKYREVLSKFFILISALDVGMFSIVSLLGEKYISIRFFGLAILNGTSTSMWICIIKSAINKTWHGEELTNYQTKESYIASIAQVIGASIAIVLSNFSISINILIWLQIIGQISMAIFDYKSLKIMTNKL